MAVSETIVREFFELHGFLVRQCRKYVAPNARDEEIDFLVLNPQPAAGAGTAPLPFVPDLGDLPRIASAVVVVRGWHTETFSPARLAGAPELFRFVEPATFQQAVRAFGGGRTPAKILVVPALPQTEDLRQQSIALLRAKGVDAVIPFRTLLAGLIEHVEPNRNYQKSDLLQTLRVLKNYDFFREPQLDLFKPRRRRARPARDAGAPAG
jgi:hypothetical protein